MHLVLEAIWKLLFTKNDIHRKINECEQIACVYQIRLQINTNTKKKKKIIKFDTEFYVLDFWDRKWQWLLSIYLIPGRGGRKAPSTRFTLGLQPKVLCTTT